MLRAFGALLVLQLPHSLVGKPDEAALLDDSCRESSMWLVQTKASSRKMKASQPAKKPWEQSFYYVGTFHKSGSQLTRNVMRHGLDYLGAPKSCHFNTVFDDSFITTADHDTWCTDRNDIAIHWDNTGSLANFKASKQTAASLGFPIRIAHSMRKPKDMIISSYCYHRRGEEAFGFTAPWPFIMDMEPLEGMMALWPKMSEIIRDMLDFYTNTSMAGEEVYVNRYEDLAKSSEGFDEVVQGLFKFLFGDMVGEEDLNQMWKAAKAEDKHANLAGAISDSHHGSDDECLEETAKALLHLDPTILRWLKESQELLGYPVDENWPEPVIG